MSRGKQAAARSRREFLGASIGASAALMWRPTRRMGSMEPGAGATPPGFPQNIALHRQVYENWALELHVENVWTAQATSYGDVVDIANWAATHGWRVRPSGMRHGWAPFNVTHDQKATAKIVLIEMTALGRVSVDKKAKTVWAEGGALMDDIMVALERNGLGMSSIPAPGAITIAGALAINGHGAAVPARGEDTTGRSYGSLSNRVLAIQVVAWDKAANKFTVQAFSRSHPTAKALLTALGRTIILSVQLRAEDNVNLRCVSRTDVTNAELFAAPDKAGPNSFAALVEKTGRVETIAFPFTKRPWLKYWEVAPVKPPTSRAVSGPYNYPFSDNIPVAVGRLSKLVITKAPQGAVELGALSLAASDAGLTATNTRDLWGPSRATQHYIKATTLPATALSHAVLTSRANIQRVVHEYVAKYNQLVAAYRAKGMYPSNMPVEIRCTGVDNPADCGVAGAEPPSLSATAPRADKPEWDTVVFLSTLALVGNPDLYPFAHEFEQWIIANYAGYAMVRPEWSKAWACSPQAFWANATMLRTTIPDSYRVGRNANNNWDWTIAKFRELDPHKVFSNNFHDRLTT